MAQHLAQGHTAAGRGLEAPHRDSWGMASLPTLSGLPWAEAIAKPEDQRGWERGRADRGLQTCTPTAGYVTPLPRPAALGVRPAPCTSNRPRPPADPAGPRAGTGSLKT